MRIKLNNKFYKKSAVAEAIIVFKDTCNMQLINESFEIELDTEDKKISGEFCNYVLGLTRDENLF